MKIKFCGIKRHEDIQYMNKYKPDYAGFVFAGEKRRITPEKAAELAEGLAAGIKKVGVFVNDSSKNIEYTVKLAGLDAVQLHGDEDEEYIVELKKLLPDTEIWKAVRVKDSKNVVNALTLSADMLLFDSFSSGEYGGTGKIANIELIKRIKINRPFFIAGGIDSENIVYIVKELSPYGVDISSGIETGGVKDESKIKSIMKTVNKINFERQVI